MLMDADHDDVVCLVWTWIIFRLQLADASNFPMGDDPADPIEECKAVSQLLSFFHFLWIASIR